MPDQIRFRQGYKYQLVEDASIQIDMEFLYDIYTDYIVLIRSGLLTVKKGYVWDGCSGPTWDDRTNMRAGLFHDALYQLMRMGLLSQDYKHTADMLLKELIEIDSKVALDDGSCFGRMRYKLNMARAWYYYEGVDHFAAFAAKYGSEPYPVMVAP